MSEPVWVLDRVALAAHNQQLARHGGMDARVDRVRLSMALAWPRSVLALAGRPVKLVELAAAYIAGVLRMRPFAEGNERSAYLLGTLFLGLNGVFLRAPAHEKLVMFASLVASRLPLQTYVEWLELRYLATRHNTTANVRLTALQDGTIAGVSLLKRTPASRKKDSPPPGSPALG
jgi:death-on-curing protein